VAPALEICLVQADEISQEGWQTAGLAQELVNNDVTVGLTLGTPIIFNGNPFKVLKAHLLRLTDSLHLFFLRTL
jgi:hypothetical protein